MTGGNHVQAVVLSAGGNGSVKSTAMAGVAGIALDSTLSDFAVSRRNIDRALSHGRIVVIVFVWRDPIDAFIDGVVPRFRDVGRPVTIPTHAATHAGAPRTLLAIAESYRDKVATIVLENRTGEPPMLRHVEWLRAKPSIDEQSLKAKLGDELETEVASERLSREAAQRLRHSASSPYGAAHDRIERNLEAPDWPE